MSSNSMADELNAACVSRVCECIHGTHRDCVQRIESRLSTSTMESCTLSSFLSSLLSCRRRASLANNSAWCIRAIWQFGRLAWIFRQLQESSTCCQATDLPLRPHDFQWRGEAADDLQQNHDCSVRISLLLLGPLKGSVLMSGTNRRRWRRTAKIRSRTRHVPRSNVTSWTPSARSLYFPVPGSIWSVPKRLRRPVRLEGLEEVSKPA